MKNPKIGVEWNAPSRAFRIRSLAIGAAALMAVTAAAASAPDAVFTTAERTIVPRPVPAGNSVAIDDPGNFAANGFGFWDYGPGVPNRLRLDLMLENYDAAAVRRSTRLLRFFTLADVHLTDKESPAQAIYFKHEPFLGDNVISVYSPVMLYTTHVLDAAVRTINRLHAVSPMDFGINLGDMANSAQYNELRWFIDIMDGKRINPDSGAKDDPIPGPYNDYQDEFDAEGLNPDIPWYATIGNHDHFWMGSKPINDELAAIMVGDTILQMGNIIRDLDPFSMRTYSAGVLDGSTPYGTIIGSGVVAEMDTIPTVVADPLRKVITKEDVMEQYRNSTSQPSGHGYNSPDLFNGCYTFEPVADLPIRVIVLDNTMENSDPLPPGGIEGYGTLNHARYEWLMEQLQAGQDENKLMIIAAHIPIGVSPETPTGWMPSPPNYTSEVNLIHQLQAFPNLILWLSGHRHLNQIMAFPSSDSKRPENGFWQVETKSLREFPQQFRTLEIFRNDDHTLSIFATAVDPDVVPESFADTSRSYAVAAAQILNILPPPPITGPLIDNAELVVPLSPVMQQVIAELSLADPLWQDFARAGDWLHGWLGWITEIDDALIYHKDLGFLYYEEGADEKIWFYVQSSELNWLATTPAYYPYCYSPVLGWLYHEVGSRRFYEVAR